MEEKLLFQKQSVIAGQEELKRIERKIDNRLRSREITMIDYGLTNDFSKFVTEISIPVR